jgi:hypothetical protein
MKKEDIKQLIKEELKDAQQAKNAAKQYSTKTVKGFKPWDQMNQVQYEAFLAGVEWARNNESSN